jgi:hypothetical protein
LVDWPDAFPCASVVVAWERKVAVPPGLAQVPGTMKPWVEVLASSPCRLYCVNNEPGCHCRLTVPPAPDDGGGVEDGVGVGVGLAVGPAVGEVVGCGVGVAVGWAVAVGAGGAVAVAVGTGVGVAMGSGVVVVKGGGGPEAGLSVMVPEPEATVPVPRLGTCVLSPHRIFCPPCATSIAAGRVIPVVWMPYVEVPFKLPWPSVAVGWLMNLAGPVGLPQVPGTT